MIRPVIRSVIRPTVRSAGEDSFGPELADHNIATYQFVDANNYSEYDAVKGKFHLVSDGTYVSINYGPTSVVSKRYRAIANNYEGFGKPAINSPGMTLTDGIPVSYVADVVSTAIKRNSACNVYFNLSIKEVSPSKGVIR